MPPPSFSPCLSGAAFALFNFQELFHPPLLLPLRAFFRYSNKLFPCFRSPVAPNSCFSFLGFNFLCPPGHFVSHSLWSPLRSEDHLARVLRFLTLGCSSRNPPILPTFSFWFFIISSPQAPRLLNARVDLPALPYSPIYGEGGWL